MDDIERELLIMDMQEECDVYDQSRKDELSRNPLWWNIKLGLIESTPEQEKSATKIFREFSKFKSLDNERIEDKFQRFEQYKLFNGYGNPQVKTLDGV
jgi:hypothetical protein